MGAYMEKLIIHYNDGEKKQDLVFRVKTSQEALAVTLRELSPEVLWARGWDKKYCWNEVR